MSRQVRLGLLIGLTVATTIVLAAVPPIAQDPEYHRFADRRSLVGIPNALNVLSNTAFVLVGAMGLWSLARRLPSGSALHLVPAADRWPYVMLFAGVTLTGFGSAYYHLAPDNARLVWDRLPMTVAFAGVVAAVLSERISRRVGILALPVLLAIGTGSVLYWWDTEGRGAGDLRAYVFAQFFPLLVIPLVMLLFPSRYTRGGDFLHAAALYGVAKACEAADARIFGLGGVVSGHTLKHLVAAAAILVIVRMLLLRVPWRKTNEAPS